MRVREREREKMIKSSQNIYEKYSFTNNNTIYARITITSCEIKYLKISSSVGLQTCVVYIVLDKREDY